MIEESKLHLVGVTEKHNGEALRIVAFGECILIRPDPVHEGAVLIPESAVAQMREKSVHMGVVLSVGSGRYVGSVLFPLRVAVGQHVVYARALPTKIEGEELDICGEQDIVAILE